MTLPTRSYSDLITAGAEMLISHHAYWRFNAFKEQPSLIAPLLKRLQALDETALWALDNDTEQQAEFFGRYFPELFSWLAHAEPRPQPTSDLNTHGIPFWLHTDAPGRKWQQVQQFCAALPSAAARGTALEWCAGKGHLGRLHSWRHQQPVLSIEWDTPLCSKGQRQAQKLHLAQRFINADVFQLPLCELHPTPHSWLALHACGELHCEFLRKATALKAQHIALAPCCYHRQPQSHYQPLSCAAKATGLESALDTQALRLAQQNQITAGRGERNKRATELNWRLGYEALRQTLEPNCAYRNLPSIKSQAFSDFAAFCHWAAERHQLALPAQTDWQRFERHGQCARIDMMRRDAIRHCFRRALELWLALDKAVYLEQQGYRATLLHFCEPRVSPRNLLLMANRAINTA
ncbi:MAG TPA: methyltransferase [Marinagarivorans sp.]